MKIKWWQYVIMGLAMLFVHPFMMFWEFCHGKCKTETLGVAVARSFLVPLFVFLFLPAATSYGQIFIKGFIMGWWTWSYLRSVVNMTHNQVRMIMMEPIMSQVFEAMEADVSGDGDPEAFKKTVCDIAEKIYGKRPDEDDITVEVTKDGLRANVMHVAIDNSELPRETAIKITQEIYRRKHEQQDNGDVLPSA